MNALERTIRGSVLIADADPASRARLQADLLKADWEVHVAATGQSGLNILQQRPVCAAILDLRLPDMNGQDWVQQTRTLCPATPVLAIASEPSVDMAVEAMKAGACDVMCRPLSIQKISGWLENLVPAITEVVRLGQCATVDPTLAATYQCAASLAGLATPIALCGPAGTGRKTLATAMHDLNNPRRPITIIDMANLSPEQAKSKIAQIADLAAASNLILADVQALKNPEQDKLASLLAAVAKSGRPIIISIIDRPEHLLAKGQLSRALAAAIEANVLLLPPLSARLSDLPLLAEQILSQVWPQNKVLITPLAMQALTGYDWPGNVRQLRLVLERAVRLAVGNPIEPRHLPILQAVGRNPTASGWLYGHSVNLQDIVDDVERHLIAMALHHTNKNQAKAADLLTIPRTTLRDKLAKHGFLTEPTPPS